MVVAGGGTGGHLFPGLAVAEFAASTAGASVVFIGSQVGIESRVIPRTRFPFHAIAVEGVRGRGLRGAFDLALQLPPALLRSWSLLGRERVDVVVGVGGYASFPVVVAAWLRRIPAILLEQNVRPGLANRTLGRFARKICTTFAEAQAQFPQGRSIQTGNPVRELRSAKTPDPQSFTLLVFGGSQGARHINDAFVAAAPTLRAAIPNLRIIHQTGADDVERLRSHYAETSVDAEVHGFIDDMGTAYGRADLVVCRSGATTIAEITNLAKAAIMIPFPFAADDHQRANAEVLAQRGACLMVLDRELSGDRLAKEVIALATDRDRLRAIGEAAHGLAVPDAAARVVDVCRQVVGEG